MTYWIRHSKSLLAALLVSLSLAWAETCYAQGVDAAETEDSGDQFLDEENGWETYVNGRFGMQVSYPPDLFTPAEAIQTGNGRRFEGKDAHMEVYGWENERSETSSSFAEELVGSEGYESLGIKRIGEDRLILSGSRQDQEFYELYVFRGRSVQAFGMEYPTALRASYDPLREAIAATFLHGDEAAGMEVVETPPGRPVLAPAPMRDFSGPRPEASASFPATRETRPVFSTRIRVFFERDRAEVSGGRGPEASKRAGKPAKARGHGPKRWKAKGGGNGKGKGKGKGKKK